jgi:hypothetical protein
MRLIPWLLILALSAIIAVGCSNDDNPSANDTYTMTTLTGPNGTITPAGSTTVARGSNLLYTMHPDSGYHVDSVLVDGVLVDSTLTFTFVNIVADHLIRAVFAAGSNPPANYVGVMAGTGVSGTLSIHLPAFKRVFDPSAAPGDTLVITGSLDINGGATITLTGILVVATGELHLDGGGYSFTGALSGNTVTGTFTYTGGNGIFRCDEGTSSSVKSYCGRYQQNSPGTDGGYFNMTVSGSVIYVLVYPDDGSGSAFSTTGSINSFNVISIYDPANGSVVIASGTLNPTTHTVSGTYLGNPGGTWSGGLCN